MAKFHGRLVMLALLELGGSSRCPGTQWIYKQARKFEYMSDSGFPFVWNRYRTLQTTPHPVGSDTLLSVDILGGEEVVMNLPRLVSADRAVGY